MIFTGLFAEGFDMVGDANGLGGCSLEGEATGEMERMGEEGGGGELGPTPTPTPPVVSVKATLAGDAQARGLLASGEKTDPRELGD